MERRNDVFHRLKPPCVALCQAATALHGPNGSTAEVAARLDGLHRVLCSVAGTSGLLDAKLADYVFFALSQVLQAGHKASVRCVELSIQCLTLLVAHGWRSHIPPQLAAQIVLLCTLVAAPKPAAGFAWPETTAELHASAFWCLHHTFSAVQHDPDARKALIAEASVPQLGQTITTILDRVLEGGSADAQLAGVSALQALMGNVATPEIQAGFLPGTVSKLTRLLTPQTQQRRSHAVLVPALDTLTHLFQSTLSDAVANQASARSTDTAAGTEFGAFDAKWFETAAAQLKAALTNIARLKDHSRLEVKEALAQLCFTVLQHCAVTLQNCASLCLETLVLLSSGHGAESIRFRLESLISIDSGTSSLLQDLLYDWLQSLPTRMQAADECVKLQRLQQLSTSYNIVLSTGMDTSLLDRTLATVLRDSVVVTLQEPLTKHKPQPAISVVQSVDITLLDTRPESTQYRSALARHRGQEEVLHAIQHLAHSVSTSSSSTVYSADLARSLRQGHGDVQVANFWLLLNATRNVLERKSSVDDFLNLENHGALIYSEHLEDLFSFSLAILTDTSDELMDPRLQSLALQTLALRAQTTGHDFRYDLIDALYPVLHTLATPDERLQQDSIATLNVFTAACGYESVKDLIVLNADYLTNAVALKLNAFDVSPQSPQVLLMMVRLAGPSLLPYLEDTLDSIFAALEDYHGYPLLVELLFRVLSVVAEEGSKAPQLAITDAVCKDLQRVRHYTWKPTDMLQLSQLVAERASVRTEASSQARTEFEPHPQRPWKDEANHDEESSDLDQEASGDTERPIDIPDPPPPAPQTYNLLLKIAELTQHFLPSASASLRKSLLTLIKTTTPAIALHENSFLPMINTLWPEVVSRLDDQEPYVVATALEIIALLCTYAGDFIRSRIQQLWPALVQMHGMVVKDIINVTKSGSSRPGKDNALVASNVHLKQALCRMRTAPAEYCDTGTRMIWTSLVQLLTVIVRYVPIQAEQFDQVLDMLEPVIDEGGVREALEEQNPDAVWLVRARRGRPSIPEVPAPMDDMLGKFAAVPG